MVPREAGNNAYAKFWRDKQKVLWYFWKWPILNPAHAERIPVLALIGLYFQTKMWLFFVHMILLSDIVPEWNSWFGTENGVNLHQYDIFQYWIISGDIMWMNIEPEEGNEIAGWK